jgi:shikimate kinase
MSGRGPAAILIGPPGAGKSTVGPVLAERLGVTFLDTDAGIEAEAGKPVSDIFVEDGEDAFRALERAAVARAVAGHPGVLGLGGGAVLDAGTQELLAGQPVVYLETSFGTAVKRVGLDTARPLLLGNPRTRLRTLLDQRLPVYQRLAWLSVSTDDRSPEDIAAEIARRLAGSAASADASASPGPPR